MLRNTTVSRARSYSPPPLNKLLPRPLASSTPAITLVFNTVSSPTSRGTFTIPPAASRIDYHNQETVLKLREQAFRFSFLRYTLIQAVRLLAFVASATRCGNLHNAACRLEPRSCLAVEVRPSIEQPSKGGFQRRETTKPCSVLEQRISVYTVFSLRLVDA